MSISDNIRTLANEGLPVADIARRLGIRYQHAYKVLKDSSQSSDGVGSPATKLIPVSATLAQQKPALAVTTLLERGFELSGRWMLSDAGDLLLERPLSKDVGVYAFAKNDVVLYVGVATMGLAKRIYFYGRPGVTQITSLRLNSVIKTELKSGSSIHIYTASPPDLEWNGLPVHGSAGLELGLIKKYSLPWNIRSAAASAGLVQK